MNIQFSETMYLSFFFYTIIDVVLLEFYIENGIMI